MSSSGFAARAQSAGDRNDNMSKNDGFGTSNNTRANNAASSRGSMGVEMVREDRS